MISTVIEDVVSNYVLAFLVINLVVSVVAIARAPRPINSIVVTEKLLAW